MVRITTTLQKIQWMPRDVLKFIAFLAMICDHIGVVFFAYGTIEYTILRTYIGRISFPIFCVLFVESFFYVKKENWKRHIRDLCIFALLSEIPYDMALMHSDGLTWYHQNVLLSWLWGFLLLMVLQQVELFGPKEDALLSDTIVVFVQLIMICLAAAVAYYSHLDYAACCQICIGIGYLMKKAKLPSWSVCIAVCICLVCFYTNTWCAFLAVVLFLFYDGHKQTKYAHVTKYLYYIGYPAHLWFLLLILKISDKILL